MVCVEKLALVSRHDSVARTLRRPTRNGVRYLSLLYRALAQQTSPDCQAPRQAHTYSVSHTRVRLPLRAGGRARGGTSTAYGHIVIVVDVRRRACRRRLRAGPAACAAQAAHTGGLRDTPEG